jgi:competence protein ComEC
MSRAAGRITTVGAASSDAAGRPSLSPLLWTAVVVWGGSLAGTEIALAAWRTSTAWWLVAGAVAVVGLGVVAVIVPKPALRLVAAAGAGALAIALLHGAWLSSTAATLEARGLADWNGAVCADPMTGQFGTSVAVSLDQAPWGLTVTVNWPKGVPVPAYGRRVTFSARLVEAIRGAQGSDDAFRRAEPLRASPWRASSRDWAAPPLGPVAEWRDAAMRRLQGLGVPGADVLASMMFRAPAQGAAAAVLLDAKTVGVAWAIMASGLHLAVLVLLFDRLGALAGLRLRGRATLVLGVLGVATFAAGLKLSLVRAALVAAATVIARLAGRRRDPSAVLGAVVSGMLLFDPLAAYDVGLLLGVIAMAGIVLFGGLARTWLRPITGRALAGALGVSFAAQVATAPLVAGLFGGVSPFGPLVLVASAPVVGVAVSLGYLGAVTAPVVAAPGTLLLRLGSAAADAAARLWALVAGLSGSFVPVSTVPWWVWGVWPVLAAGLWLRWPRPRRSARVVAGLAAVAIVLGALGARPATVQSGVVVMDIGQGDAILVKDGGHTLLVDTGPDPVALRQALARAGVHSLDGLVLTHAHADHTGGLDGLAGVARPPWIGVPDVTDTAVDALARRCASRTDRVVRLRRDMTFTVGRTTLRVLWPTGGESGLDANNTSVVLLLERDGRYALLLGDAEETAQMGTLQAWAQPVEMMKVAHHGSTNGSVPAALAVWRPSLALISVGVGNKFGHPHAAALASLAGIGAVVRRTDRDGDLGWDDSAAAAAVAPPAAARAPLPAGARASEAVCDNRLAALPYCCSPPTDPRTDAWLRPTSLTSSSSISSTVRRNCCWSAPRSACATASLPWPTSTSTWRPSTGIPPPPKTSSTPPTPCLS